MPSCEADSPSSAFSKGAAMERLPRSMQLIRTERASSAITRVIGRASLLFSLAGAVVKCERRTFSLSGGIVASYNILEFSQVSPAELPPDGEDRCHDEVADELVAGVD